MTGNTRQNSNPRRWRHKYPIIGKNKEKQQGEMPEMMNYNQLFHKQKRNRDYIRHED